MAGKKFDITKFAATLPEAVPESLPAASSSQPKLANY